MRENTDRPICHRADDMMAFLYDEASPAEAEEFAGHMGLCAACRTEFSVFNQVRESMSLWRTEVLGMAGPSESGAAPGSPRSLAAGRVGRRLSAWAAVREFFVVSPVWLRGATALATLLLCVLGALFAARMLKPSQQLYTEQELNAKVEKLVDQRTKEKESAAGLAGKESPQRSQPENSSRALEASANEPQPPGVRPRSVSKSSRPFLSRAEREQLAADLGLKPGTDEENISFLLDGGSN
ncbi:MAG: hypothetical protein ABJC05_00920 [Pyrinomonadaceae bacterium]